jgi:hypothetical protein
MDANSSRRRHGGARFGRSLFSDAIAAFLTLALGRPNLRLSVCICGFGFARLSSTAGSSFRKIPEDFPHLFPGFSSVPSESRAFSPLSRLRKGKPGRRRGEGQERRVQQPLNPPALNAATNKNKN